MSNRREDYKKVTKKGEKDPNQPNNLIKITTAPGRIGRCVGRAVHLFNDDKETAIYLRGAGNASPIALQVALVVRRRIRGLHQIITFQQSQVIDEYEPKKEGLEKLEEKRTLCVLEIKLTKEIEKGEESLPGYESPIPDEQIREVNEGGNREYRGRGGRGRGYRGSNRGSYGNDYRRDDQSYRREDQSYRREDQSYRREEQSYRREDQSYRREEYSRDYDDDYNRDYSYSRGGGPRGRGNRRGYRGGPPRGGGRGGYRGERSEYVKKE